jgi:tryptophan halogenase
MSVPESLERKLALFRGRGRNLRSEGELFGLTSWVAVMLGQGVWPEDYDPSADALDEGKVRALIEHVQGSINQTVLTFPAHLDFLQRSGGAAAK